MHYTDKEVLAITDETIALPLDYVHPKTVLEQNLATIKTKFQQEVKAQRLQEEKYIQLSETTPLNELATVLGDATKLAKTKNCYLNYKKLTRNNDKKFLMHKYDGKIRMEEKCEELIVQL